MVGREWLKVARRKWIHLLGRDKPADTKLEDTRSQGHTDSKTRRVEDRSLHRHKTRGTYQPSRFPQMAATHSRINGHAL